MKKINKEQLIILKEYRDYVNSLGGLMPEISEKTVQKINETKKYHYMLGVLIGTELLKAELRALVVLSDYILNLRTLVDKQGEYIVPKIKDYENYSYGTIAKEFCKKYKISEMDPDLSKDIWELNRKRNDLIHHAIFKFRGDLDKADEEIREYAVSQVIDSMLKRLTAKLNFHREENALLDKQIRQMGLL